MLDLSFGCQSGTITTPSPASAESEQDIERAISDRVHDSDIGGRMGDSTLTLVVRAHPSSPTSVILHTHVYTYAWIRPGRAPIRGTHRSRARRRRRRRRCRQRLQRVRCFSAFSVFLLGPEPAGPPLGLPAVRRPSCYRVLSTDEARHVRDRCSPRSPGAGICCSANTRVMSFIVQPLSGYWEYPFSQSTGPRSRVTFISMRRSAALGLTFKPVPLSDKARRRNPDWMIADAAHSSQFGTRFGGAGWSRQSPIARHDIRFAEHSASRREITSKGAKREKERKACV